MNFRESEFYLLSLGNEVSAMKLGLENIRTLLVALGNPQNNFLKVQIAGTNGKGSVCAFLDAICVSAGVKTGLFTSPHLVSIRERIKIDGIDIGENDFARHATFVRETAERLVSTDELKYRPTFFEQITAIALVASAAAKVKLAILETGLGGRLDATTAASAEIAAITRIDYDHQEYLGNTLADIAAEKAAIIRPGSIAIIGEQPADAGRVIIEWCKKAGVSPKFADFMNVREDAGRLVFGTDLAEYEVEKLGLAGRHQVENAKVALLVAEELARHFTILQCDMIAGMQNARHPGRLEYQGRYLFDGAHNLGGAKALAAYLDEFETRPITLVFGAMKGKDVAEIAKVLFSKADKLILTRPSNSRALNASEIVQFIPPELDKNDVSITDNVADALAEAEANTDENGLILITGSLYLVGEAKKIIDN